MWTNSSSKNNANVWYDFGTITFDSMDDQVDFVLPEDTPNLVPFQKYIVYINDVPHECTADSMTMTAIDLNTDYLNISYSTGNNTAAIWPWSAGIGTYTVRVEYATQLIYYPHLLHESTNLRGGITTYNITVNTPTVNIL